MSIIDEIHSNRELFLRFNDSKYRRFQQLIGSPGMRKVVNSIPLLLSTNHARLPGYVEGDVPHGIVNYTPDAETVKYLRGRFVVKDIRVKGDRPLIEMMAVMGSVGTIAYTKDSDFDYWVCVDRTGVTREGLELFQRKVDAVQEWAMDEAKIEAHIFINDIGNIKNNQFAESKEEAFGSIIGAVLKDEFFRSSIIIAGKTPFWWVLPRYVRDNEYEKLYGMLSREARERDFIDLGNLYEISKEDFIGAALFLIIKSLGNPFKSILKLGLLEKYLFGPDHSPLLSQVIKSNILRGNMDNRIIDSYILMFEEVYRYYESIVADKTLLTVLRQNLYLKINPQLSRYIGVKDRQGLPYKVLVMLKYVKDWGWTGKEIDALDSFESWDYNRTIGFWNMVKKFMLMSYQKIATKLPAMNLKQAVSDTDFRLLSGKIKSHFSQEHNKIDQYITFKETPHESILVVEPAAGSGIDDDRWSLVKRTSEGADASRPSLLKTEKGLVRLLAWTAINGIFNPRFSRIKFQSGYGRINQNSVIELTAKISGLFSGSEGRLKNEYFLRTPFNIANMIIVNFGIENAEEVSTVHHIYQTSWGESYIDEYGSHGDLVSILADMVGEGIRSCRSFDETCVIVTPEPFKKHYKEIDQTFRDVYEFITKAGDRTPRRCVVRIGGRIVAFTRDGENVTVGADADFARSLTRISLNPLGDVVYSFIGSDPRIQAISEIFRIRKKNAITVVYEMIGKRLLLYLVNERDNILTFIKGSEEAEDALIFFLEFMKNVMRKMRGAEGQRRINESIRVFEMAFDRFGKIAFEDRTRRAEETYLVRFKSRKGVSARVARNTGKETLYAFTVQGGSLSGFMPLKGVPGHLLSLRASDRALLPMIADIEFIDLGEEEGRFGSTPYLLEKYRIELMIDMALKQTTRPGSYREKT